MSNGDEGRQLELAERSDDWFTASFSPGSGIGGPCRVLSRSD